MPRAGCGQTRGARIASRAATRKWTSIDPEASCVVEMRCARSTWSPSARSGVSSRLAPPVTRSEEHTPELQPRFGISSAVFFLNETATTEIYTLSLHDALPICRGDEVAEEHVVPIREIGGELEARAARD